MTASDAELLMGPFFILNHLLILGRAFTINRAVGLLVLLFPNYGYPWLLGAYWKESWPFYLPTFLLISMLPVGWIIQALSR